MRVLILLILLSSCSPQRRFTRLITKHPHLIKTDTIIQRDTVKINVPQIKHDTAFLETQLHDTIRIEKERLKIKIWRKYDTIRVQGECDSLIVTKIIERKVPVKYYEKSNYYWWVWVFIVIIGAYLILNYGKRL